MPNASVANTARKSSARKSGAPNDGDAGGQAQGRRPGSWILDIYGLCVRHGIGSWLATSTIVRLMADLDVDDQAVRSALSRMKRKRMLESQLSEGRRGYALTPDALAMIEEGDERIFHAREPSDLEDGWVLVVFSIPESERDKRHLLRSRLEWLGFGNQVPGVWIAPARLADDAARLTARLGVTAYVHLYEARYLGFSEASEHVRQAWDLPRLAELYDSYIADHADVAEKWAARRRPTGGTEAFADFISALHEWRKFPYLDPGLPSELVLPDWSGHRAAEIFFALLKRLEPAAIAHVKQAIAATTPAKRAAQV
jgi:phenylacetic acid degradation operon negative regulatory protein